MGRYLPLLFVVLLGAAFAARYALSVDEWRVMTDELLYVKLAVSISDSLSPLPELRGHRVDNYSLMYPLLLSPIVGVFDMPTAFKVAHGLNALLMASTAIPTYLMARMVVDSRWLALLAGAIAATVPWVALAVSLMTEPLAYAAFAWSAYAIAQAVAGPSPRRDLAALLSIALVFLTRAQFVFVAAAFPVAIVLHEFGFRATTARVRRWPGCLASALKASARGHWVVVLVALVGGVIALRGSAVDALGPYVGAASDGALLPKGILDAMFDHVNHVLVGIGIIPLPLTAVWIVQTVARPGSRSAHALAITIALLVSGLAVVATRFGVLFVTGAVQERYIFYMAPLLLVGAVACLAHIRKATLSLALAGVATVFFVVQTKYVPMPAFPAFASPVEFTFVAVEFRTSQLEDVLGFHVSTGAAVAAATVAVLAGIAVMLRTRWAPHVPVIVGAGLLVWCVAVTLYAAPKLRDDHEALAVRSLGERPFGARDWVDEAVPDDANVAYVPSDVNARGGRPHRRDASLETGWWEAEFWNKTVNREFLYAGAPGHAPFPGGTMTLDRRSGRLEVTEPEADYLLLAHTNVRFAPVAVAPPPTRGDLALYRPRRPYRAAWATSGVFDDGTVGGGEGSLSVYRLPGQRSPLRRVSLTLASADKGTTGYRVTAPGVRLEGTVERFRTVSFRACVPPGGRRAIRIRGRPGFSQLRVVTIAVTELGGSCPDSLRGSGRPSSSRRSSAR